MSSSNESQAVQIKLFPALTADEKRRNIIANIVVEDHSVPYIDDVANGTNVTQLDTSLTELPRLRYYAVGPGTYKIKCPLCQQQADAAVMRVACCIKDLSCCLSLLSCCFPLFWLCCLCSCCSCHRQCTSKALYCNKCGGKLGIQHKVK